MVLVWLVWLVWLVLLKLVLLVRDGGVKRDASVLEQFCRPV